MPIDPLNPLEPRDASAELAPGADPAPTAEDAPGLDPASAPAPEPEPEDMPGFDVVVVGCGVAGLFCTLNLPDSMRVLLLSKGRLDECDSMLAQGGMSAQVDDGDYKPFFDDTMRAGHFENRTESVDIMVRQSRDIVRDLLRLGVSFAHSTKGVLARTREAAHSRARVLFHDDVTGAAITESLLERTVRRGNVMILERCEMTDITEATDADGIRRCTGVLMTNALGEKFRAKARYVVLATGGVGGLYPLSTNFRLLTGDGIRVAEAHGVEIENLDYVQFHPTSLYTGRDERAFLITEAARGEGAVLLNKEGARFVDELLPRDVVTKAIYDEMDRTGESHVWLSFENVPRDKIMGHFRHIWRRCMDEGYDITKEPIPVAPAQHYLMGGIRVDRDSRTSLAGLFAVGETSCNGVHGRNRLASNSLLEALVFSKRAAKAIERDERSARDEPDVQSPR